MTLKEFSTSKFCVQEQTNLTLKPFVILSNTAQNPLKYILKATLISLIPIIIFAAFVLPIYPDSIENAASSSAGLRLFWMSVLFAPLIETLIQLEIIIVLLKITSSRSLVIILSAFFWAWLHALFSPTWGIMTVWSFAIYSFVCIEYLKYSRTKAFVMTCAVHMAQNTFAFFCLMLAESM